jgi:RimJ/RimL family protein N-acetyltransferase
MEAFLRAAQGADPEDQDAAACTIEEAAAVLAVADAARVASSRGTPVQAPASGLALRAAKEDDAERLLRWRNDLTTRSASFNGGEVSRTEHAAWLQRTLADPDRRLLIATEDGEPVGQLRFDRLERGSAFEVHIALAPEARGHGLATALLSLAIHTHVSGLGATWLLARVKPGNEPSRRSFRGAGFQTSPERPDEWWLELPEHSRTT